MQSDSKLAAGTGSSLVITRCQVCDNTDLRSVLFLGFLPPVNQMRPVGQRPHEQPAYPAELLFCPKCSLVQLGLTVDPNILFPPDYPYTSGTTKILRENFADLYDECRTVIDLSANDLIIDIGANDGTLLANFQNGGHRVLGVEPTGAAKLARERGIMTVMEFFSRQTAHRIESEHGKARVITATNVFAHMETIHDIVDAIVSLIEERGVFISESHYLVSLIESLQYDTIYHEHLRYYSLTSLSHLLRLHGLEVIHARRIPTHGGSIRVYAVREGAFPARPSVAAVLSEEEKFGIGIEKLEEFKRRVALSKLDLYDLLADIKKQGHRIYALGAPSRASTLVNYVGLDDGIIDCVLEIEGSRKIGKYIPGTVIPVVAQNRLFADPPDYVLLLSWHIADELVPRLRGLGFKGKFIVPLPEPEVIQ
jgi:hypothetical protein